MFDEESSRRPGWTDLGERVLLADGRVWTIPQPLAIRKRLVPVVGHGTAADINFSTNGEIDDHLDIALSSATLAVLESADTGEPAPSGPMMALAVVLMERSYTLSPASLMVLLAETMERPDLALGLGLAVGRLVGGVIAEKIHSGRVPAGDN